MIESREGEALPGFSGFFPNSMKAQDRRKYAAEQSNEAD
jgi:hypothetical protein